MKVLFVGEGAHDVGEPDQTRPSDIRRATGVVPVLARKICPLIDKESIAMLWTKVPILPGTSRKPGSSHRGYERKIIAAVRRAEKLGCAGTIAVTDQDRDSQRANGLREGTRTVRNESPEHSIATGLAIRSIEAWTLGAKKALAAETGRDISEIEECYPKGKAVEDLNPSSGKKEQQPKKIVERIAKLANRDDCLDFRRAVAARTDITELEEACPRGFAPFAKEIRDAFGSDAPAPVHPACSFNNRRQR